MKTVQVEGTAKARTCKSAGFEREQGSSGYSQEPVWLKQRKGDESERSEGPDHTGGFVDHCKDSDFY